MKAKEIREKTEEDLLRILMEKRDKLREFRFAASGGRAGSVKDGRALRADIARIFTELRSRST